jgi:hypothetical protein
MPYFLQILLYPAESVEGTLSLVSHVGLGKQKSRSPSGFSSHNLKLANPALQGSQARFGAGSLFFWKAVTGMNCFVQPACVWALVPWQIGMWLQHKLDSLL